MALKYKNIEKIAKGFANHWRIQILELLGKRPGLSVDQITESLKANFITISVHLQKMTTAGLIAKKYQGRFVLHSLTRRGSDILKFCRMLK